MRLSWLQSLDPESFPTQEYEQLRQSLIHATPFNHLAWLRGAELALGNNQQLHILMGWIDEQLVLCLPLIYSRERYLKLPVRIVRHLGYPMSDRLALMILPEVCAYFPQIRRAIERRLPHALLQLSELTPQAAEAAGLQGRNQHGWLMSSRVSCLVPEHVIDAQCSTELSGTLAYKVRKARKRCLAINAQVLRVRPTAEEIGGALVSIREVEQASWKGDEGVGIFSDPAHCQWMDTAFSRLAEEGMVYLVMLQLDDRCISYRLGLMERGRLYDYNLAFLPEYASLSSGRLLLDEWITWGVDSGWERIDASRVGLRNSTHQLHERMSGQIEQRHWNFYSLRPAGVLLNLSHRTWNALKPQLQRLRDYQLSRVVQRSQS